MIGSKLAPSLGALADMLRDGSMAAVEGNQATIISYNAVTDTIEIVLNIVDGLWFDFRAGQLVVIASVEVMVAQCEALVAAVRLVMGAFDKAFGTDLASNVKGVEQFFDTLNQELRARANGISKEMSDAWNAPSSGSKFKQGIPGQGRRGCSQAGGPAGQGGEEQGHDR